MNLSINQANSTLQVTALDFSGKHNIEFIKPMVESVAKPLIQYLPKGNFFLYIRDIKDYSIDGKYPAGHTYNRHEVMVAVPNWDCNKDWITSTVAHELHHLVRWQHAGYGSTFGEAILSEGLATYYESIVAGWVPPWAKAKISTDIIKSAKKDWNNPHYNHFDWFFEGEKGRWLGYTIGYKIAKQIYKGRFDLKRTFKATVETTNAKSFLDKLIR